MRHLRKIIALLLPLLPGGLRMMLARRVPGWRIHPTARIGRSLVMVDRMVLGPDAVIGAFNVIRDLDELVMERGAVISTRNSIQGHPLAAQVFTSKTRRSALVLREEAMITIGHSLDCCDRIEFARRAVLAGYNSQILTHSLDLVRNVYVARPVLLGERSAVMSGCILQVGVEVPDFSIVSAGSVVTTKLTAPYTLYRGNPAQAVRDLPPGLKFFTEPDPAMHRATG